MELTENISKKKIYFGKTFILLFIMLFFIALDLKSSTSDEKLLVVTFSLISFISGIFLIQHLRYINKYSRSLTFVFLLFMFFSSVNGLMRGQSLFEISAVLLPLILFIISMNIIASIDIRIKDLNNVILFLFYYFLIAIAIKMFLAFFINQDLTLENVRYQIISPFILLFFSYGISSVLYKRQKGYMIALLISILVVMLSITRTYILVYSSVVLFWLLILPFKFWIKKVFNVKVMILLMSFLILLIFVFPEVMDRWVYRLFYGIEDQGGIDITYYTRIAEISYQVDRLLENSYNLFTGLGLAAKTEFAKNYLPMFYSVFQDNYVYEGRAYGHNTYVGIIYISGFFLGGFTIFKLVQTFVNALILCKKFMKLNQFNNEVFILGWGTSSVLGYLILSFFGGTFGDRASSVGFGIAFGLIFLAKKKLLTNEN